MEPFLTPIRPTLAEVAHRAGVSVASASRALSGGFGKPRNGCTRAPRRGRVGLRDRRDGALAQGAAHRTVLALAVADLGNPVYVTMMRAIENGPLAGYRLVLTATGPMPEN